MITQKELADECKVSVATISNILNGKSNVSEDTKKRILKIMQEKGYKPNYLARGLRASSTKTIGLIVDDFGAFGTPEIIEGIVSFCEKSNYKVVVETLRIFTNEHFKGHIGSPEFLERVDSVLQEMLAMRVDGVIYVAAFSRSIDYLPEDFPVPIVLAYASTQNKKIHFVLPDDEKAAFDITDYLIKKGNKKIAIIKGSKDNIHSILREQGFIKAMKENSLQPDETLFEDGGWTEKSGYEACKKVFEHGKPDAIFSFNDSMAAGAYQFLYEKGLTPGKDISVVGFDNKEIARCLPPPLTTLQINGFGIGRMAAIFMIEEIEQKDSASDRQKTFYIPCELIERQSVRKIN